MKVVFALIISLSILTLSACDNNSDPDLKIGKYGMMSDETPQYAATLFFVRIYTDNNLEQAANMSTDKFANLLRSYHTNKNVQRHVLNLRVEDVEVEPMASGMPLRSIHSENDKVYIEVKVTGSFDGDKITDLKRVELVRQSRRWLVNDVSDVR